MRRKNEPGALYREIVKIMMRIPDGVTAADLRAGLGLEPGEQEHLGRRLRDMHKYYKIQKAPSFRRVNGTNRAVTLYKYIGERDEVTDEGQVSQKVRAAILHGAFGRCQMCGQTIEQDGIKLVVDHKIPRNWGGSNDPENLWAICETCNGGKKAHFASVNASADIMKRALVHHSVRKRIGELLLAYGVGVEVPTYILEIVAGQDEWRKRLRELRYPVIGWEIDNKTRKINGRKKSFYVLKRSLPWPPDPDALIRQFEEDRKKRNREGLGV